LAGLDLLFSWFKCVWLVRARHLPRVFRSYSDNAASTDDTSVYRKRRLDRSVVAEVCDVQGLSPLRLAATSRSDGPPLAATACSPLWGGPPDPVPQAETAQPAPTPLRSVRRAPKACSRKEQP
jgi:hypothetical protein